MAGEHLVFLGDFVDRGPDVRGTIRLVLELLRRQPCGSAVMGNHDLALVRAARLDGGAPSPYWIEHYRTSYDHQATFESYLGRPAVTWGDAWLKDLDALRQAMPAEHRDFLASLPWVVESRRHIFVHCGLSPELAAGPEEQVIDLRESAGTGTRFGPVLARTQTSSGRMSIRCGSGPTRGSRQRRWPFPAGSRSRATSASERRRPTASASGWTPAAESAV